MRLLFAVVLLLAVGRPAVGQIVYTLVEPVHFAGSPYGFSGTVTTDGSTGVLTTVDFVTSWSIMVFTPGDVDGVTAELLDPTNSTVSLELGTAAGVIVTPESISFPLGLTPQATLRWATAMDETVLQFTNRAGTGGGVTVFDPSEPNGVLGVVAGGAPIASDGVLVPEPAGSGMAMGWALAIGALRCRGWRVAARLASVAGAGRHGHCSEWPCFARALACPRRAVGIAP